MVGIDMPCRARVARETREFLEVAMKNHIRECDLCIRELINDFVGDSGPDMEESE